jgi:hypothetical protein
MYSRGCSGLERIRKQFFLPSHRPLRQQLLVQIRHSPKMRLRRRQLLSRTQTPNRKRKAFGTGYSAVGRATALPAIHKHLRIE